MLILSKIPQIFRNTVNAPKMYFKTLASEICRDTSPAKMFAYTLVDCHHHRNLSKTPIIPYLQAGLYASCVAAKQSVKLNDCAAEFSEFQKCLKSAVSS